LLCSLVRIGFLTQARAGFATCYCTVESWPSSHLWRNSRSTRQARNKDISTDIGSLLAGNLIWISGLRVSKTQLSPAEAWGVPLSTNVSQSGTKFTRVNFSHAPTATSIDRLDNHPPATSNGHLGKPSSAGPLDAWNISLPASLKPTCVRSDQPIKQTLDMISWLSASKMRSVE
jgi:hypothetical protein